MFKYVGDISDISHYIIDTFLENKNVAVDCTLGNGHDTDFLSEKFSKVYSFDIQESSIENYNSKNKENVNSILDSHEFIDKYIDEKVDCIIYNLGFLPGSSKEITTILESTLKSIEKGLDMLNSNAIMSIAAYPGHEEGRREYEGIIKFAENLSTKTYGVMIHKFLNRHKHPPVLIIIEKNEKK